MGVEWNQSLSVGVKEVDNQHKELFKRVSDLLDALSQGKGRQEVGNLIKFLADYTVTHFRDEEALMAKHNYPGLDEQKKEHAQLIKDLGELKKEFEAVGPSLTLLMQIQRKAVDWLTNHISKSDKKIGEFLNTKK